MYIVFEGIDGSGKGTQIQLTKNFLDSQNVDSVVIAEPHIIPKNIIFHKYKTKLSELLLFISDRLMLYNKIEQEYPDKIILSDRSWLSTLAYQIWYSKESKLMQLLNYIHSIESCCKMIDILFLLDIDAEIAYERVKNRNQKLDPHEKIEKLKLLSDIYYSLVELWRKEKGKIVYILDASQPINVIQNQIQDILKKEIL